MADEVEWGTEMSVLAGWNEGEPKRMRGKEPPINECEVCIQLRIPSMSTANLQYVNHEERKD